MKYYLGVDIGGTKILAGLVGEDGVILTKERYPTKKAAQQEAEDSLFDAIDSFLQKNSHTPPVAAGIGAVGHIDPDNGVWLQSYNIPIGTPVPIAERIYKKHGIRAFADNDVHAATLAEIQFGRGCGSKGMLYVNIGTGLAAGYADRTRLLRGADNYAGEAGYMVLDVTHPQDTLEKVCSGGGILSAAKRSLPNEYTRLKAEGRLNIDEIFKLANANPAAKEIADRAVSFLGFGLCNLAAMLNPDAIVFGGGCTSCSEYINKAVEHFREHCVKETLCGISYIGISALGGDDVGLLGAAAVAKTKLSQE